MGMVVRTNTMANNAFRQLGMNNSAVSKSLEKLSSGFRINRAGDDASGLAISEKMKAQIKGLEQASTNSQDGISLIQTAEGALTEVHNMLNRMVELATKSANGTIQNEVDRENIQNEVNALIDEIDRIGNATNFNGIQLLDGTMGSASSSAGGETIKVGNIIATNLDLVATENAAVKAGNTITIAAANAATEADEKLTVTVKDSKGISKEIEIAGPVVAEGDKTDPAKTAEAIVKALSENAEFSGMFDITVDETDAKKLTFTGKGDYTLVSIEGETGKGAATALAGGLTAVEAADANTVLTGAVNESFTKGDIISVGGKVYELVEADGDKAQKSGAIAVTMGDSNDDILANLNKALEKNGYKVEVDNTNDWKFTKKAASTAASGGAGSLTLQIGDTSAAFNKLTVSIGDMRSSALGVDGVDVSSQEAAGDQIDVIKAAINTVSMARGDLGALQNRLEYTINNLDTTAENMTSANSRIRDTDMAKEMMQYTKMNVLVQSAQAMLAQANQQPQSILQLLQ